VADIKKYDKLKAVRIHYADYKSAWANSRELKFSSVFHNDCKTLGLFHEIAVGINAGEEISKAVLSIQEMHILLEGIALVTLAFFILIRFLIILL
jgi:hypothetical protein